MTKRRQSTCHDDRREIGKCPRCKRELTGKKRYVRANVGGQRVLLPHCNSCGQYKTIQAKKHRENLQKTAAKMESDPEFDTFIRENVRTELKNIELLDQLKQDDPDLAYFVEMKILQPTEEPTDVEVL